MDWVEAEGKTVEVAVQAALDELGLESQDQVEIEVLQEPTKGFLGLGGQDAIVKVIPRPKRKSRRRRGRGGRKGQRDGEAEEAGAPKGGQRDRAGGQKSGQKSGPKGGQKGGQRGGRDGDKSHAGRNQKDRQGKGQSNRNGGRGRGNGAQSGRGGDGGRSKQPAAGARNKKDGRMEPGAEDAGIEEQAVIAKEFLTGLLDAFGLEGTVETRIEEDVLYIDVDGEQTEALVGSRGVIMQSVNELTRTVIQRRTHGAPRMRLDISGYNERRREALKIYAGRLAEQVLDSGEEIALEPMHAADRKVVHDVIAEVDGVESFSEGEEPNRAVVVALAEGYEARQTGDSGDAADSDAADSDAADSDAADDSAGENPEPDGADDEAASDNAESDTDES